MSLAVALLGDSDTFTEAGLLFILSNVYKRANF